MLPYSVRTFVETTKSRVCAPDRTDVPYRRYYRSVAAILLCGRVRNTTRGGPNMNDGNRLCKEANISPRNFQLRAEMLIGLEVVRVHGDGYARGAQWDPFFGGSLAELRRLGRGGFGALVQDRLPPKGFRPGPATDGRLDGLFLLYCAAFRGLGVHNSFLSDTLAAFAHLPPRDLVALAAAHGEPRLLERHVAQWGRGWLDASGMHAVLSAAHCMGWFERSDHGRGDYLLPSYAALVMLGLETPAQPHVTATDFRVQPDLSVLAGEDLPIETLVPLFRGCRIRRIDRIIQFQISQKHLNSMPGERPVAEQVREALRPFFPLPSTVDSALSEPSCAGGSVAVRACNGLIRVDDPGMVDHIRQNSRLRGYLEPAGPPGYLVVKYGSSLNTFVRRCQEFGISIKML